MTRACSAVDMNGQSAISWIVLLQPLQTSVSSSSHTWMQGEAAAVFGTWFKTVEVQLVEQRLTKLGTVKAHRRTSPPR